MNPLHVVGMHGLGDNVHQRAIVRELRKNREVWLETPWPCLYHDMPDLTLISRGTRLRTQAKNLQRENAKFFKGSMPLGMEMLTVSYRSELVRTQGSVLGAMSATCRVPVGDFRLPVPDEWGAKAKSLVEGVRKPLMVFRPLVVRKEWGGNAPRNADPEAYLSIYKAIRDRYFVISIADLEIDREWAIATADDADLELHHGELDAETLIGLFSLASLVYTSSGFAVPLAQAVRAPIISVFGGYESSWSFSAGAGFTEYLGIDPIKPCSCFSHVHPCDKRIDIPKAIEMANNFAMAYA